jgi:hypothetical protein
MAADFVCLERRGSTLKLVWLSLVAGAVAISVTSFLRMACEKLLRFRATTMKVLGPPIGFSA